MLGREKAIRRVIFVASFFLVCSFAVSLIQAQSLQKPHSIPPQLYPESSSTAIASNVIPNTYLVRVSSSWIKSVSQEPSLADIGTIGSHRNFKGIGIFDADLSSQLKCQDESFGLYRFVGNESALIELKAKANLAGIPFTYQPEHYIQRRSLKPNDPLLPDQQYLDVIQMPLAWEQGMAGVNRYGDTLVVAVVDDGMDTSHPDLRENIWVNRRKFLGTEKTTITMVTPMIIGVGMAEIVRP